MKICVLAHLFPARSETFVREHVMGLARRGHEVTVIAREVGDGISAAEFTSLEAAGVRCVYVGNLRSRLVLLVQGAISLLRTPGLARALWRPAPWKRRALVLASRYAQEVARVAPDVVHIHFGSLAARVQRVTQGSSSFPPAVVTWHGYDVNALPKTLGNSLYRELFAAGWSHTVGSRFIHTRLCRLGAIPARVSIIPMGIDLGRFTFRERQVHPQEPLSIISVGRLDDVKGHSYLIEAVGALVREGLPLKLVILGSGPNQPALQKQVSQQQLSDVVTLVGSVEPEMVVKAMHEADVFALTGVETAAGKVESQGVVFAEAQATGLPVIGSNVGGVPESVIDGETAILCPPADVAAVVNALRFFANNREVLAQYGRQARQFVEQHFSVHLMIDSFESLYQRRPSRLPRR